MSANQPFVDVSAFRSLSGVVRPARTSDFETEFRVGINDNVLLLAARGKMLIDISDASKALETHQKSRRKSRGNQSRIARA